ncbi:hypothetical protein JCM10213_009311 [Rhodosporidiobolus nylandii]
MTSRWVRESGLPSRSMPRAPAVDVAAVSLKDAQEMEREAAKKRAWAGILQSDGEGVGEGTGQEHARPPPKKRKAARRKLVEEPGKPRARRARLPDLSRCAARRLPGEYIPPALDDDWYYDSDDTFLKYLRSGRETIRICDRHRYFKAEAEKLKAQLCGFDVRIDKGEQAGEVDAAAALRTRQEKYLHRDSSSSDTLARCAFSLLEGSTNLTILTQDTKATEAWIATNGKQALRAHVKPETPAQAEPRRQKARDKSAVKRRDQHAKASMQRTPVRYYDLYAPPAAPARNGERFLPAAYSSPRHKRGAEAVGGLDRGVKRLRVGLDERARAQVLTSSGHPGAVYCPPPQPPNVPRLPFPPAQRQQQPARIPFQPPALLQPSQRQNHTLKTTAVQDVAKLPVPAPSPSPASPFSLSPTTSFATFSPPILLRDPPAKLSPGEPNPQWLGEALFGPEYGSWAKGELTSSSTSASPTEKRKGQGKGRKRAHEEQEEDVVGDGIDYEDWEERKRGRKRVKR